MHTLILLFLALPEYTNSAPPAQRESQIWKESLSGEFGIDSNDRININNGNDAELPSLESPAKYNLGRQVKMDDYELLKNRRTILDEGNVDLIVDFIDLEMEASKNWNKVVEDLKLGESDLVIYLEIKKKIIFMENQMRKHEVQHVAVKPFDKNLKTLKSQFQKLSDKIGSNESNFIKEFFQHADKFLKEAQAKILSDDHDAHNGIIKTAENIKKTTQVSNEESIEENGSHFHPKFKYFWNKEGEDVHKHQRTQDESDSVMKSAISKSWFGWSLDVLAVVGFVIVLVTLALVKLVLSRRRGSLHNFKVAKC